MIYKTINSFLLETHPWEEYIPNNANKLILGTFPTKKENRSFEFYYPNKTNRFWRILSEVANIELTGLDNILWNKELAIIERKRILNVLNLGITDIGKLVLRQNDSSADENLFPIEFKDIFSILDKNIAIDTIILTSSSGANSVYSWFSKYCKINNIIMPSSKAIKKDIHNITKIYISGREVNIYIVHSTSKMVKIPEKDLFTLYKSILS